MVAARRTIVLTIALQCVIALAVGAGCVHGNHDLIRMVWGNVQHSVITQANPALPDTFCSSYSSPAKCERAVETMTPVLLEWINRRVSTEEFFMIVGARDDAAAVSVAAVQDRNSADCSLCKYAVAYVKTEVQSQATKEAISNATQEACAKLPIEFQDTCLDIIVRYEELLIEYIQSTSAADFCLSVGACKASTLKPELPPRVIKLLQTPRIPVEGSFCGTCKMVVEEAHALVNDPDTQQEITDFIKTTCAAVVPAFADICSQYVDEYAPAVFALLDEYLTDDLCTTTGFCDAPAVADTEDMLAVDAVLEEVTESGSSMDAQIDDEVQEQQAEVMAYVASVLMDEDEDFVKNDIPTQDQDVEEASADVITPGMLKNLGITQRMGSKADTKTAHSEPAVVSRRLLADHA